MEELPSLFRKLSRTFAKGDVLLRQGDRGREMFVIYSGMVELSVLTSDGAEVPIATLGPGEFFGEMSLIDGSPRSATATIAADDTCLIALDRTRFDYIVRHEPEFAFIIMETLCQRIRAADAEYAHFHQAAQGEQPQTD